jgi:catechol 2,3-dioxygenase-like lactoylglutathione lyase family enzyme
VLVRALDHIALWTPERDAVSTVLVDGCGMHEIQRTDDFTLVGGDARGGKLTLFDADAPRDAGALAAVGVRVPSLADVRARLARMGIPVAESAGETMIDLPSGVRLALVEDVSAVPELDHVVLRVRAPDAALEAFEELGLDREDGELCVAGARILLRGGGEPTERPLLNHLGLLVDDSRAVESEARGRGLTIDRVVDAENTRAVFVEGPDGILVEYVEHKPGFSLV